MNQTENRGYQNRSNNGQRPSYQNRGKPRQQRPQEPEYVSPIMNVLAHKLVLNFYLYAESKNYPVMNYIVYDSYVLAAMVGAKFLPKDFARQVSSALADMGYTLLRFNKSSFILIRTAHVANRWTRLGHNRVSKRPNDTSVLKAEIERLQETLGRKSEVAVPDAMADAAEQNSEVNENLNALLDQMREEVEALTNAVSVRDALITEKDETINAQALRIKELEAQLAAK